MSANGDDDDRKPSARKLFDGGGDVASPPPLLLLLLLSLSLSLFPCAVGRDPPHIVNIRTYDIDSCSSECTGTLLTNIIVLTSVTCTVESRELNDKKSSITSSRTTTPKITNKVTDQTTGNSKQPVTLVTKSLLESVSTAIKIGDIKVYLYEVMPNYRNATHKYVHPEWNPVTNVADVALVKIEVAFAEFDNIVMPDIMYNNFAKLPEELMFRGFGKIDASGNRRLKQDPKRGGRELTDQETLRRLKVNFTTGLCPIFVDGISKKDTDYWWSFMCTPAKYVRTKDMDTLCTADIGGPLYDYDPKNGHLRLYGIFSHAYHIKFPFCATQLCYLTVDTRYPCNDENSIYYRHTAITGRFASWLNRTVEWDSRTVTKEPTTEDCPTEEGTTETPSSTTLDPMYDEDEYQSERKMVSNKLVCKKEGCKSAAARDGPPPPLSLSVLLSLSVSFFPSSLQSCFR